VDRVEVGKLLRKEMETVANKSIEELIDLSRPTTEIERSSDTELRVSVIVTQVGEREFTIEGIANEGFGSDTEIMFEGFKLVK